MTTKIIIDCDPGCDDTIALIAALTSDKFDVLGITSIGGNVDPVITQKNVLGICALLDRTDIPTYAGCDKPLVKQILAKADDVHGKTGVKGLKLPFERAGKARTDMDAADFILKTALENKADPVTLVVIGPMTNIALAYQRNPEITKHVKEIVTMGGAFGQPGGNITPYAEFNIFCDPHAAKIVYDNFTNIRTLPLDVTHQTLQDPAFRDWVSQQGTQGENVANMLKGYAETYPGMDKPGVSPLHDFHTIAALCDESLYAWKRGKVAVEVDGEREGQTILLEDPRGSTQITTGIDKDRFFDLLKETLVVGLS